MTYLPPPDENKTLKMINIQYVCMYVCVIDRYIDRLDIDIDITYIYIYTHRIYTVHTSTYCISLATSYVLFIHSSIGLHHENK